MPLYNAYIRDVAERRLWRGAYQSSDDKSAHESLGHLLPRPIPPDAAYLEIWRASPHRRVIRLRLLVSDA